MILLQFLYKHFLTVVLALALVASLLAHVWDKYELSKQIVNLQNDSALASKTIEEKDGLYARQAVSLADVLNQLDAHNAQIAELEAEIKKNHEQISDATSLTVYWKKAYEGTAKATIVTAPPSTSTNPNSIEVDFAEDFNYLRVDGWTRTNPRGLGPESWLKVTNLRPLKLTVALSQDAQDAWHAYATSSEQNIGTDITVSAVNPHLRDIKWYEKIGFVGDLGIVPAANSGVLTGIGATFEIGNLEVGPKAWLIATDRVNTLYGATVVWHPWRRE